MVIEGIFDGTAVRPLNALNLSINQKVYITVPSSKDEGKIKRQLDAVNKLSDLLSSDESKELDEALFCKD